MNANFGRFSVNFLKRSGAPKRGNGKRLARSGAPKRGNGKRQVFYKVGFYEKVGKWQSKRENGGDRKQELLRLSVQLHFCAGRNLGMKKKCLPAPLFSFSPPFFSPFSSFFPLFPSFSLVSHFHSRVCRFAGLLAGLQVCRFAGLRVYGFAGVRVCKFAGLRVCKFAGLRLCGFAGLQVCNFLLGSLFLILFFLFLLFLFQKKNVV